MKKVIGFEETCFSNFYKVPVWYKGLLYKNSEAAYQAQKTTDKTIQEKFTTLSGYEARKLGHQIELRPDWESIKLKIMEEVCIAKFLQNPDLYEELQDTRNEEIINFDSSEGNFWGCYNGSGENNLGKILMKIRNISYWSDASQAKYFKKKYENIEDDETYEIAKINFKNLSFSFVLKSVNKEKSINISVDADFDDDYEPIIYDDNKDYTSMFFDDYSPLKTKKFLAHKLYEFCEKNNLDLTTPFVIENIRNLKAIPENAYSSRYPSIFNIYIFNGKISPEIRKNIENIAKEIYLNAKQSLTNYMEDLGYTEIHGEVVKQVVCENGKNATKDCCLCPYGKRMHYKKGKCVERPAEKN